MTLALIEKPLRVKTMFGKSSCRRLRKASLSSVMRKRIVCVLEEWKAFVLSLIREMILSRGMVRSSAFSVRMMSSM